MIFREIIDVKTEKSLDKIVLTERIRSIVKACRIKEGLCNIYCPATTAGFMVNENEPMLVKDVETLIKKLAPDDKLYQHPSNGYSHLRATFSRQDITVPFSRGDLILGTWQDIILWEFDTEGRNRKIIVTIVGDC
ncbi:MAG: YjbQ family protein [Candidatus Aenigmarchaeota archaeon]|nr:YjbQ family protein [Candidatus Aenigmarchaeota archaeon]